jgi:D-alanyl-D-alanine carboxypeptidase
MAGAARPSATSGASSTNFLILGAILEKVTGQPAADVITAVARQAGLAQTALAPAGDEALPYPHSDGYIDVGSVASYQSLGVTVEPGTDTTDWSVSWAGAAAGMYSTVQDLFDWAASGLGASLLPAEVAAARPTGSGPRPGWIGSDGQAAGWATVVAYEPATGATFAGIVNSSGGRAALDALFETVFPKN